MGVVSMAREIEAEEPLAAAVGGLRRAARGLLASHGGAGNSLASWDLVGEAIVRLLRDHRVRNHPDAGYVHRAGERAMIRILIDRLRARKARKRGGDARREPLEIAAPFAVAAPRSTLHEWEYDRQDVQDAVARLESVEKAPALALRLHVLDGLPVPEVAARLGVTSSSVHKYLSTARTWIHRDLTRLSRERRSPRKTAFP